MRMDWKRRFYIKHWLCFPPQSIPPKWIEPRGEWQNQSKLRFNLTLHLTLERMRCFFFSLQLKCQNNEQLTYFLYNFQLYYICKYVRYSMIIRPVCAMNYITWITKKNESIYLCWFIWSSKKMSNSIYIEKTIGMIFMQKTAQSTDKQTG